MDPQLKSILTSVLLSLATAATTWAVTKGIVPSSDQNVIANDIAGAAVAIGGLAVGWYKTRQASPAGLVQSISNTDPKAVATALNQAGAPAQTAVIQAVNHADNGVKVVSASSTAPQIDKALTSKP